MNPHIKRPPGITLLAIVFFYIGCIGTILFPFMATAIGPQELWSLIPHTFIRSETLLKLTGYLFLLVWYLLYILYACIGFALWRLRNWGRRAIQIIALIGIALTLVLLPFLRPLSLIPPIAVGNLLACIWPLWYLNRPNVRFAFGVPTPQQLTPISGPPPMPSRKGPFKIAATAVVCLGLVFATASIAVESTFRTSEPYKMTLNEAANSPCVAASIGMPFKTGWNISGNFEETGDSGKANLSIPIHRPKGTGDLDAVAKKQIGTWTFTTLTLTHNHHQDELAPTPSTSCP
jgi:hypothetical protein